MKNKILHSKPKHLFFCMTSIRPAQVWKKLLEKFHVASGNNVNVAWIKIWGSQYSITPHVSGCISKWSVLSSHANDVFIFFAVGL